MGGFIDRILKVFFLIEIFTVQKEVNNYIFFCSFFLSNLCVATENGVKLSNISVLIPLTNTAEKTSHKAVLS